MWKALIAVIMPYIVGANYALAHKPKALIDKSFFSAFTRLNTHLSEKQKKILFDNFDSRHRNDWHFVPRSRRGLSLKDLNENQKDYVLMTLKNVLSDKGFITVKTIMQLENILRKEEMGFIARDPDAYYLEIFGNPSPSSIWGLSFEGHHLSLNYIIENGSVKSFSPMFFGANPAEVKKDYGVGPAKGTRPLIEQEEFAFELLRSLSSEQKKVAIVSSEALDDVTGEGRAKAPAHKQEGISANKLTKVQLDTLKKLIESYLKFLPKSFSSLHENVFAEEVNLKKFYFSWFGGTATGEKYYYRIDHPEFMIELANTQSDVSGNPANHVHTLWMSR